MIATSGSSNTPLLFDRDLARRRLARAIASGPATFLLDRVTSDLADRLSTVLRRFPVAADIGTPGCAGANVLQASGRVDSVLCLTLPGEGTGAPRSTAVAGSEEALPFAHASLDLIVSLLTLHGVNDLPGALVQARRALRPDGLFLACLAGGDTLLELRRCLMDAEAEIEGGVSPRVFPFADVREIGGLLQRAGFALPVTDVDRVVVRYPDVFALMRDLRAMGATNVMVERRRRFLRRDTLMRAAQVYAERFADSDGRIRATFDLVWLSGWAPHESQQKPLRPGSAKARLADALGVAELSAGEKPRL
jgi:SAM-dependent methyltransferase